MGERGIEARESVAAAPHRVGQCLGPVSIRDLTRVLMHPEVEVRVIPATETSRAEQLAVERAHDDEKEDEDQNVAPRRTSWRAHPLPGRLIRELVSRNPHGL